MSLATIQSRSIGVDLDPEQIYDAAFTETGRLTADPGAGRGVEPGGRADLVVRKPGLAEDGPEPDLLRYLAIDKTGSVDKVIVNGRLAWDGGPVNVDPGEAAAKLASKVRQVAQAL